MTTFKPKAVLILSGKRKCGKDFISDLLMKRLGLDRCSILRLSGPLKKQYAQEHGLDYGRLLDASDYKEKYRADMIQWGEEKRNKDPSFFCNLAIKNEDCKKDVWIISDARRLTDVEFFKTNFSNETTAVRIEADKDIRMKRGFAFTEGVDDAESECGLDKGIDWDLVIHNNGGVDLDHSITVILTKILS